MEQKIIGYKIKGRVIKSDKEEFKFKIIAKNEELIERIQKIEKTKDNFYQKPYFEKMDVNLVYLTKESLKGLYKNPEKNLPYEILDGGWKLIYRQDALIRKKENIFNELEQTAIDEGLRN